MKLSGKASRFLRSLGHELSPVVQVGKEGVTDGLVAATARALLDHELIKVRVGAEAPDDRVASAEQLSERTGAALVQVLGRTCLLYRRHPEKPRITLPKGAMPGAAGSGAKGAKGAMPASRGAAKGKPKPVARAPRAAAPKHAAGHDVERDDTLDDVLDEGA